MKDNYKNGNYISWYSLEVKDIYKKLNTSSVGLTSADALERQNEFGLNKMPSKKVPAWWLIFFHQFLSPLIYILIIAGVVSIFLKEWEDAGFIFTVILLNSIIGAWQENKAEKSAAALQNLLKIKALVRRDNLEKELDAEELVVGDIVFLESGYKVPADIRLFDARNLTVDEAFLTGESKAVLKNTETLKKNLMVNKRVNMLFAGSTVFSGRAWGVVVETGLRTEVGKIADIITATQKIKPPLIIRMEKFTKNISFIILFLCVIIAAVALAMGAEGQETFFLVVALAVSAIPEGLPVALTVALSVATSRMSKKNVIVRKLTAVEGLGSCTMIASDKTGTLTVNQQTAKLIHLSSDKELKISGEGYSGEGVVDLENKLDKDEKGNYYDTIESVILANEAYLVKEDNYWRQHGDSIDVAFLALTYKSKYNLEKIKKSAENLFAIPYESERRYAGKFYKKKDKVYFAVKGSVDRILDFCDHVRIDGKNKKIDKKHIKEEGIKLAKQGYRVLAVARGEYKDEIPNDPVKFTDKKVTNLRFLSLICFIDPLRAESREAILKCQKAGIGVKMITGDHSATALFIAKELGIANSEEEVVNGENIEEDQNITPEFLEIVKKTKVFAGVSPLQKLKIVNALNKLGHFVAVTGDGVNDAPAMKQASIGVAMGSGTDVAKETSTMIVVDDNFSSIVDGIEEGRFAYSNIRKVVYFLISSGATEIILFLLAIISIPLLPLGSLIPPLIAAQLLWLNVVTNGIQDIALAFESGEKGEMKKVPRSPKEGIFNRLMTQQTVISGLVMGIFSFAVWFYLINLGYSVEYTRNILLMLIVLFQNFHIFNCRSEYLSAFKIPLQKNKILIFGVLIAQALHITATYIPFMQNILQLEPISFFNWLILLVMASSILWAMEIFKYIKRKKN
jgi:magnesium-transporting ATPase (P-type)